MSGRHEDRGAPEATAKTQRAAAAPAMGKHLDRDHNGIADWAEAHPYLDTAAAARGAFTARASGDTLWADVSSWQPVVSDAYPYRVLAIRSNDGTYRDPHFAANYAWALDAMARGRLDVLIVYFVYRTNTAQTISTHTSMLGSSRPGVVSMIDVESWGGQITGNQSAGINWCVDQLAAFHGGNRARVIGYGNRSDLNALWPSKPAGMRLVVAAYGSNPDYPGKFAHQFSDSYSTPPFGACDINSADGMSVADVKAALGLTGNPTPTPIPGDDLPSVNDVWAQPVSDFYTPNPSDGMRADVALGWAAAHAAYARQASTQAVQQLAGLQAAVDKLADAVAHQQGIDPADLKAAVADAIQESVTVTGEITIAPKAAQ